MDLAANNALRCVCVCVLLYLCFHVAICNLHNVNYYYLLLLWNHKLKLLNDYIVQSTPPNLRGVSWVYVEGILL